MASDSSPAHYTCRLPSIIRRRAHQQPEVPSRVVVAVLGLLHRHAADVLLRIGEVLRVEVTAPVERTRAAFAAA